MNQKLEPTTSDANGRLWGARAHDWAHLQEATARPVYEAVAARVGISKGTKYLDLGCGSGVALQVAETLGADVTGIDAAEALLEFAKTRVPDATLQHGDLENLPFTDDTFDTVTAFNSLQYCGNPTIALSQARRVTKPGGSIVIMTWGNPQGMDATSIITALKDLMPPPPPGAPGPFALSDPQALKQFALDAGLKPVEIFNVDCPFVYPDKATAVRGFSSAGVAVRAMENSSEQAVEEAYAAAFSPFRQADGSYSIGATFQCLLARP